MNGLRRKRGTSSSNLGRRSSHHSSSDYNTSTLLIVAFFAVVFWAAWSTAHTDIEQLREQIRRNQGYIEVAEEQSAMALEETAMLNERVSTLEAASQVRINGVDVPPPAKTKAPIKAKTTTRTVKVTYYCACSKCCGKSDGITASGKKVKEGITAAMNGVPFGTQVKIPGVGTRIVQDRVGRNGVLDIYVASHAEALKLGTFNAKVTVGK